MSKTTMTIPPSPGRETKRCLFCNEPFDAQIYNQRRYCPGRKCRQLAYVQRNERELIRRAKRDQLTRLVNRLRLKLIVAEKQLAVFESEA